MEFEYGSLFSLSKPLTGTVATHSKFLVGQWSENKIITEIITDPKS